MQKQFIDKHLALSLRCRVNELAQGSTPLYRIQTWQVFFHKSPGLKPLHHCKVVGNVLATTSCQLNLVATGHGSGNWVLIAWNLKSLTDDKMRVGNSLNKMLCFYPQCTYGTALSGWHLQCPASLMALLQGKFNQQSSMDELCNQISAGQTDQLIAALVTIKDISLPGNSFL